MWHSLIKKKTLLSAIQYIERVERATRAIVRNITSQKPKKIKHYKTT